MICHVDGRPGNTSRVHGRREGLVSTAPSQDASSVEHLGEPQDPNVSAIFHHCGDFGYIGLWGYRLLPRGRHLNVVRVCQLVIRVREPWSRAAWSIGGVSLF